MKRILSAWALALAVTAAALPASAAAFSDVPSSAWYAQAVEEVTQDGLMNGVGDGAFDPDGAVTRGMTVADFRDVCPDKEKNVWCATEIDLGRFWRWFVDLFEHYGKK